MYRCIDDLTRGENLKKKQKSKNMKFLFEIPHQV
jgi:hypothetical protein